MASGAGLEGVLYTYDSEHSLVAFESPSSTSPNALIFVGGLGDGLNAISVLEPLSKALTLLKEEWSLIQVLTRSSYEGWGSGDVDRDAQDLYTLEKYLREKAGKKGKLVLLGHSTGKCHTCYANMTRCARADCKHAKGCQDIVRFFQLYPQSSYAAAILQAPVSDREYAETNTPSSLLSESIQVASEMMSNGKGHHPIPPEIIDTVYPTGEGEPPKYITASRWYSLAAKGGKEDYFSSDLSDDQLNEIFKPFREVQRELCIFLCEKDETYPKQLDILNLLDRFENASGSSERGKSYSGVLKNANHCIEDEGAMKDFIDRTVAFLNQL